MLEKFYRYIIHYFSTRKNYRPCLQLDPVNSKSHGERKMVLINGGSN